MMLIKSGGKRSIKYYVGWIFLMQSGYKMFWDLTKKLKKWMELMIKVIMEEKVTLKDKGEKRLCGLYQKIIGWMKKGNK